MSKLLSSLTFIIDKSSMANDVIQASDGNYIIVGRTYEPSGSSYGFAMKVTGSGSVIWEQTYKSSFSQWFEAITQIADGTYIAVGSYFYSKYAGDEYIWVVNLDEEGNIISQNAYGNVGIQSDGYDIKSTKDGGFVVLGTYIEGNGLTWVLKFNTSFELQWDKKYDLGISFALTVTMDDGYALVGSHHALGEDNSLFSSPFIMRLDSKGKILWQKVYDKYSIYVLLNSSIIETSNGHFAIAAKTVAMEVDSIGNIVWSITDEDFRLSSILQTSYGSYGISGNVVVNYYEHAYIANLNKYALISDTPKKILWDNVDIEYNSSFNSSFLNDSDLIVSCGYISVSENILKSFFTIFDSSSNLI